MGSMDFGVAGGAIAVDRRTEIMKAGGDRTKRAGAIRVGGCVGMALETEVADFGPVQHARVG